VIRFYVLLFCGLNLSVAWPGFANYLQYNVTNKSSEVRFESPQVLNEDLQGGFHAYVSVDKHESEQLLKSFSDKEIDLIFVSPEQMRLSENLPYVVVPHSTPSEGLHFLALPELAQFPIATTTRSEYSLFNLANFVLEKETTKDITENLFITTWWDPNVHQVEMPITISSLLNDNETKSYELYAICELSMPIAEGIKLFKSVTQSELQKLSLSRDCKN